MRHFVITIMAALLPVMGFAQESVIRVEAKRGEQSLAEAVAAWQEAQGPVVTFPLARGWHAIALGPMSEEEATQRMAALKAARAIPADSFIVPMPENAVTRDGPLIGITQPGAVAVTTLPATIEPAEPEASEPEPMPMPAMDQVQRALRWAGRYDGPIDGNAGAQTWAAINAETADRDDPVDSGTAMHQLIQRREAWVQEMGLVPLQDAGTGLTVTAPMGKLQFDRAERALSIYAPKDGSDAALILFSQPGGQQELQDFSGLVVALGWVPRPERVIKRGHILLDGRDEASHGRAEGWVRDGRAEGYVLIWPAGDEENQRRIAAELSESLTRSQ